MAEKLLKDCLYGDLLSPEPGYVTDFAVGMTYSLSFEAMLTAQLAFGMLGDVDENIIHNPHLMLDAIAKSSDKVVVFCNKGGIAVPQKVEKVYSLMEKSIVEVFDKKNYKANFHPKLWLIRETNCSDKYDVQLKLIVTSRNLAYTDNLDCVVCMTGKVIEHGDKNRKHNPLASFIKAVAKESSADERQRMQVRKLADDLETVPCFDVDSPFDDYCFCPYLFGKDFGLDDYRTYLTGTENIIVSPFIDDVTLVQLSSNHSHALITRKEYVGRHVFDMFADAGGVYIALDDLASRGMDLHAKMYYVWNGRDSQYLYLGSANATSTAFSRNGEFLIGLKYKYGNSQAAKFLQEFCEDGNANSKFIRMNEPLEKVLTSKWDVAETAMKELMCAEDLKARVVHHRDGSYSITVSSELKSLDNDVFIAPLHRCDLLQKWAGKVTFTNLTAEELSEFFIMSSVTSDGISHKATVKIRTEGIPPERDTAIYKRIISNTTNFFSFLELMLTDTPLQYISTEMIDKKETESNGTASENMSFGGLYEKMLRIAANNPAQILEIGKLVDRLEGDIVPDTFKHLYKQFTAVLK